MRREDFLADDFFADDLRAEDLRPEDFLAGDFRPEDFLAGDFRADDLRAEVFLDEDRFRAADLRPPDFRALDLRALDLRAPDFREPELLFLPREPPRADFLAAIPVLRVGGFGAWISKIRAQCEPVHVSGWSFPVQKRFTGPQNYAISGVVAGGFPGLPQPQWGLGDRFVREHKRSPV